MRDHTSWVDALEGYTLHLYKIVQYTSGSPHKPASVGSDQSRSFIQAIVCGKANIYASGRPLRYWKHRNEAWEAAAKRFGKVMFPVRALRLL